MEVLSARMAPAFKGEDSWKYKRVYDTKHARQSEAKVESNRAERSLNYETGPVRESGHRKLHAGGANGWEGGSTGRQTLPSVRGVVRTNFEAGNVPNGYAKRQDMQQQQESSDEELATSQDANADDTDLSGDDEPVAPEAATETPQKWPIIQIVDPPPWLPEGWTAVLRTRESGSKDKYYVDPVSQRRFRSKTEVNYFLQTGKSYRYKRNLSLLTKPLKEDPASLSNMGPGRTLSSDVLGIAGHSSLYGADYKSMSAAGNKSIQAPDLRLGMAAAKSEVPRKPYNKPGPKPKVKVLPEDAGRPFAAALKSRHAVDERRPSGASPPQGPENRGKLILKLKRKSAESEEGLGNNKKTRPFEVVGSTPVLQGRSRSTTSDEDDRSRKNRWAVDHAVEVTSRAPGSHSLVPSTHLSRRPISKAPLTQWHQQGRPAILTRPQLGAGGGLPGGIVKGHSHLLEKASASAASLAAKEAEAARGPSKRESPAEQLQRLGRKLCQQAVFVLCSEDGTGNTLQQVSLALNATMGHPGLSGGASTKVPMFNPAFNYSLTAPSPAPAAYQQPPPAKKIRGNLSKGKTIIPVQKYVVDHRYALPPYS